jgi:phage baseplate assembly protein gpV
MRSAAVVGRARVVVNGSPLDDTSRAQLTEITVTQIANHPDQFELTFLDATGSRWSHGDEVRLEVDDSAQPLINGRVSAREYVYTADGQRLLHVRGYDALHRLRHRWPSAVYERTSLVALAETWADELDVKVDARADGPEVERLVPRGDNVLQVLQRLAHRCRVRFHLRDTTLEFFDETGVGPAIRLRWGTTLREARVDLNEASTDDHDRSVRVSGWNPTTARTVESRTANDRPVATADDFVGSRGPTPVIGEVLGDEAEADALASAIALRREAARRLLWAVADGDPRLRPGAAVDIDGDGPLGGLFTVMSVVHRIDCVSGYTSEISTASPNDLPMRQAPEVQLGTVVDVDDPAGLGRVTVTLDSLDGHMSAWLQVTAPAAGPGHGMAMLPDVGDRVLVLAPDGDAARGVVLGGLYGEGGMYDSGVADGSAKRYTIRTRRGQAVCLDDERGVVRLVDTTGSYIEMAPERVVLHAETDLVLEAPGRSITVAAAAVDFVEG